MKSTTALVFFVGNLSLPLHAYADDSDLRIHIDPETNTLLQSPPSKDHFKKDNNTQETRQLLTIEASPVTGGGYLVTPDEAFLPQMSMHIDKHGYMQTICR